MTIVPEQEAFGHLHHTLTFDTYSQLAETPHGSVLAPGPAGIAGADPAMVHRNCSDVSRSLYSYRRGRNRRSGKGQDQKSCAIKKD